MLYNGLNIYIFVNGVEIYKSREEYSEIYMALLCLGSVSKHFITRKRLGYMEMFMNFLIDYDKNDVDDILDIHKYLIVKE